MNRNNHNDDEDKLNPYVALRAAKIARNEERLRELGLVKYKPVFHVAAISRQSKDRLNVLGIERSPMALRRSSRLEKHDEKGGTTCQTKRKIVSITSTTSISAVKSEPFILPAVPNLKVTQENPGRPTSARGIHIHVHDIVLGAPNQHSGLLGRKMPIPGKSYCMEIAAQCSGLDSSMGISFNKYSGIQEWKNDALFLWVNLRPTNEIVNEFLEGGRKMTWFGGSRHHDESNVIVRLLSIGQQAAQGLLRHDDGIILWCRQYDAVKRVWAPYVCLGRLSYHCHERDSRPLRFVMALLDFDRLNEHSDSSIKHTFHEIVAAGSKPSKI